MANGASNKALPRKGSPWATQVVGGATFSISAEVSNAITVSVQLKDQKGADLAVRGAVQWYLSGDANGDTLHAAAPGGVAAGTDGVVINDLSAQAGKAISESDGDLDFVITDATGVATYYLVLIMPDGGLVVSGVITFA